MKNTLEFRKLSLTKNKKRIIDNISLSVQSGCTCAIVGPNGAGKSTLAYILMGLEGYTDIEGEILFETESVNDLSIQERAEKGITLAWQEPVRFEGITVRQYLGVSSQSTNKIKEALTKVGLNPDEYLSRIVDKTLSGGERKRIELASIITMHPKLVLLDEPDSGIDLESLKYIFETILYLKKNKTTVILITHSLEVLLQADYAFLLCNGRLLDQGKSEDIYKYFKDRCITCKHKNKPDKK